jgi:uncharacterized membrane protein
MADLEFRPELYARRRRQSRPRPSTEHLEFHPEEYVRRPPRAARRRGWDIEGQTTWLAVGVGVLAGAAALYYMNAGERRPRRSRDSAPRLARREHAPGYAITGRTVTIDKPRAEIYRFWRDPKNLGFMENVERVEAIEGDAKRQRWTIAALGGSTVTVETEITEDRPNERIAWRSVEGSQIVTHGHVEFRDAPGGRGTELTAVIEYVPPGGTLGRTVAKLFRREPQVQVRHDLKRLKMLLETGEIATSQSRKSE